MKRIKLIFGTYNTQPAGTEHKLIEEAYQSAYKPFLRALYNHPEINATLHYSGTLFEWIETHHGEFTDVLKELAERKQVEIIGGAFYEPLFSLISRQDRIGQIERLTTFIRKHFGKRPRGSWITEGIWEPSLASSLQNSGFEFTFLDENLFSSAGFADYKSLYPCITEDQGKIITIFPIHSGGRKILAEESPEKVLSYIGKRAGDPADAVLTLLFNGEQYGLAEGSHARCYKDGWLDSFFSLLSENRDWILPVLPADYLKDHTPFLRGYFPPTTYEQMRFGSLCRDDITKLKKSKNGADFFRKQGGLSYFRSFLTEYPESNLMYAKMQYTQVLVNQIRGDKYRKQAARGELWRGQCHYAYWHNNIGGIYQNNLRKQTFSSLIEAEKVTREKGIFIPSIVTTDFDMDGRNEFLYQGNDVNAYVHSRGGILFELDYLAASWNYLDTMRRSKEYYHSAETAKKGYDHYLRKAFIDHFFSPGLDIEKFAVSDFSEQANLSNVYYNVEKLNRDKKELVFSAEGKLKKGSTRIPLTVKKRYLFKRLSVSVEYVITIESGKGFSVLFAPEINLSVISPEEGFLNLYRSNQKGRTKIGKKQQVIKDSREIIFEDVKNNVFITLDTEKAGEVWSVPVYCRAKGSRGEAADLYQSTCFLPIYTLECEPGKSHQIQCQLRFGRQ